MSYSVLQSLDDLESIGDAYTANMTPSNDANIKIASKLVRVSADSVVVSIHARNGTTLLKNMSTAPRRAIL